MGSKGTYAGVSCEDRALVQKVMETARQVEISRRRVERIASGYSPTITPTETGDGVTLTIIDANGKKTVQIQNGRRARRETRANPAQQAQKANRARMLSSMRR